MDFRSERQAAVLFRRYLTRGGTDVNVAVTLAATSHIVTFDKAEPDALFGVVVTPNWLTTFRVTSKATTGFTVDFGTAAPASATMDYLVFRKE